MSLSERGLFIVFEGLDRCGKSSQTRLLNNYFETLKVPSTSATFPCRTTAIGSMLDRYLRTESDLEDHAVHLLFSANRWEKMEKIKEDLQNGLMVICDRYCFSGVAYSSAKGLNLKWCQSCEKGLPRPDLVIFLDLPLEYALQRDGYGDERYENEKMQTKVKSMFETLWDDRYWKKINVQGKSPDLVHQEVVQLIKPFMDSKINTKCIEPLWE